MVGPGGWEEVEGRGEEEGFGLGREASAWEEGEEEVLR